MLYGLGDEGGSAHCALRVCSVPSLGGADLIRAGLMQADLVRLGLWVLRRGGARGMWITWGMGMCCTAS